MRIFNYLERITFYGSCRQGWLTKRNEIAEEWCIGVIVWVTCRNHFERPSLANGSFLRSFCQLLESILSAHRWGLGHFCRRFGTFSKPLGAPVAGECLEGASYEWGMRRISRNSHSPVITCTCFARNCVCFCTIPTEDQ